MVQLTEPQSRVFLSNRRFRSLVAGRRFGKTFLSAPELIRYAWGTDRLAWYVAPTYKQAKMITWEPLKKLARPWTVGKPNETELSLKLVSGGTIRLHGADNYDSLRGPGLNGLVLDEYADIAPEAWTEVLRPMLSDRMGGALFIGTPKGRNHFYDLHESAKTQPDWEAWQFTTEQGGNVPLSEIEAAKHDLDEKTFRQEYQASFETMFSGRAYYAFDREQNVRRCVYIPTGEICWSLDFNVNPMCSVISQVHDLTQRTDTRRQLMVEVIDEICLPDSNIPEACEEFVRRTETYTHGRQLVVHVYGDPAGSSRSHSGKSDWQIVREFFARYGQYKLVWHVQPSHPAVKDRINAVNSALCNAAGERRMFIDPRCKDLIKDLEQVAWKADSHGNLTGDLDKSNPKLTHVSDAIGYEIEEVMGLRPQAGAGKGLV